MPAAILVTRPAPSGSDFARDLRARLGVRAEVVVAPLMRIEGVGSLPDLDDVGALVFTSRNGVAAYAARTARRDIPAVCVGDATARAAREAGMAAVSAAGAAADLLALITARGAAGRYLHVRGDHAAADVAGHLRAAGIEADEAVLYRQVACPLPARAGALLAGHAPVIVPLFSPRSARIFLGAGPFAAPLRVVAMSENVARELLDAPIAELRVAARPDVPAMLDAVEVFVESGKSLETGNPPQ